MSKIAYTRVVTNKDGVVVKVGDIGEIDVPDFYSLENIREEVLGIQCNEKDSDLLVTLDFSENEEGITISNAMLLRIDCQEARKKEIIDMDIVLSDNKELKAETKKSKDSMKC